MTDIETITLEAELTEQAAERGIETAVQGRHAVARDEPQALTAVKGVTDAIAGAATTVASKIAAPFKRTRNESQDEHADG